jgi:glycine/D-amino acid oxidase-like deaminating enzyme
MAIMENADFDAIVIGGGFYGSIISIYLSQYKKLKRILILEQLSIIFMRRESTLINLYSALQDQFSGVFKENITQLRQ